MKEVPPDVAPSVDGPETVTFRYDIDEDEPPSHALVTVTSAITGTDPTELDPLGRHLDLEAVDELLAAVGDPPFSPSVLLETDGISLAVRPAAIVGVARSDVADLSTDGT